MTDDPGPGAEGYWESLDGQTDGGSDALTLERIAVAKCGDEWSPHAVIYAGEDDEGTDYLLVVRSRVGDSGALILSERYIAVPSDLEEPDDARWLGNGIERRVNGRLTAALIRAYARADNDELAKAKDSPALLDGTVPAETDPTDSDVLDRPYHDADDAPDVETEPTESGGRRADAQKSVDRHAGARHDTETCIECGQPVRKDEGKNIGGALGMDQWVHVGACPTDDADDGDDPDVETDGAGDPMIACGCGARWHAEADVPIDPCPACQGGEGGA